MLLKCSKCLDFKDDSEFTSSKSNRLRNYKSSHCHSCVRARHKARRAIHADKPKIVHGICQEKYSKILVIQGGGCAICGATESSARQKRLCVDHCHETGDVRGLLCVSCNAGLGLLCDDRDIMKNAIRYLNEHV